MTSDVQDLEREIEAARNRGDRAEVARLRFRLPLSSRETRPGVIRYNPEPVRLIERSEYERRTSSRSVRTPDEPRPLVLLGRQVFERLRGARYGLEDGGWLLGRYQDSTRAVEAHRAVLSAQESDRRANSLRVDVGEVDQINQAFYPKFRANGHWHSQPSSSEPSAADIELWRAARDYLGGLPFIGLVMQERLNPRAALVARAYVFDRHGYQQAKVHWRNVR